MTICPLIAGLFLPITTAAWLGVYILARLGYVCAYLQSPKRRQIFNPIIIGTQLLFPLFTIILCIVFYVETPKDGAKNLKSGLYTGLW